MNPGDSQLADWERGGHTVPGGLDDLGRRTHRITVFNSDFWDTEPATMDAQELRRDAAAAASQAPRIPRVSKRQETPNCVSGTCRQGRDACARPELCSGRVIHRSGDIPQPTEPVMSELDWVRFDRRVLYPVCVLALLACAAAVFDVRWTDAMNLLTVIGGAR